MSSCSQDLTAKNLCYLVLNKKSKPTAEVDPGWGGGTSKQGGAANQNRGLESPLEAGFSAAEGAQAGRPPGQGRHLPSLQSNTVQLREAGI